MAKIVILRGNSGSGKSTVAKALQEKIGRGTLLISQDDIRRNMLYVRGGADSRSIELLKHLVLFGGNNCDITILEGVLYSDGHKELFEQVNVLFGDRIFAYYFDLPFEETLKRHEQKQNEKLHSFGETEMRTWWREKDFLINISEKIISKDMKLNDIIEQICDDMKNIKI